MSHARCGSLWIKTLRHLWFDFDTKRSNQMSINLASSLQPIAKPAVFDNVYSDD